MRERRFIPVVTGGVTGVSSAPALALPQRSHLWGHLMPIRPVFHSALALAGLWLASTATGAAATAAPASAPLDQSVTGALE